MSSTAVLHRGPQHARSEQRTLATNTILALLIAVVGLLAAGSLPLASHADTHAVRTKPVSTAPSDPGAVARRSAALQAALLAEVAAQRGDSLAQQAETITRASLDAAGLARQQQLTATETATQAAAAQIAQQRLNAAVAARQAAVDAGVAADPSLADPTVADPTLSGSALTPVSGTTGALPAGTKGVLPVASGIVGTPFGARGSWASYHTGLDFRASSGTPIHSVLPGVVVYAGNSGDWAGNHVAVRHANGVTTMYSHMSRTAVTAGQTVQEGQVIGFVGETGRAFGPHLHFEVYPAGVHYGDVYKAVDPAPWLSSIGVHTH